MLKKYSKSLSVLALVAVLAACSQTESANQTKQEANVPSATKVEKLQVNEDKHLVIMHLNDTHGRVEEGKYDGMGYARVKTLVDNVRKNNDNVLLLDAGDTIHGTVFAALSRGESIVEIMNTMDYVAMAPGNHDFNYGLDRLEELEDKMNFEVLASNVEYKEDGNTAFKPYIIKEIDGMKIGILGVSTPETAYKTSPANVEAVTFTNPIATAKKAVEDMSKEGVNYIVAVSHLGVDEDSYYTSIRLAEEVQGIDLIVDGHSHTTLKNGLQIGDTLIVQTGFYDKNLGKVDISINKDGSTSATASLISKEEAMGRTEEVEVEKEAVVKVNEDYSIKAGDTLSEISFSHNIPQGTIMAANDQIVNPDLIYADDSLVLPTERTKIIKEVETRVVGGVAKDQAVVDTINRIKVENEKITGVVVGHTDVTLDGERGQVRAGETNLGNLLTTAMLDKTGADLALTNGGGIRASIKQGDIKKGDVISVLPFGNYVVVIEVTGQDIIDALENGIQSYPNARGAFPHVDGMKVKFDPSQEAFSRVVEVTLDNGEKLDPAKTYSLATNDFMAVGGDQYESLKGKKTLGEYESLEEILSDYISKNGVTITTAEGRVSSIR